MALMTKVGLEFVAKDKSRGAFSSINKSIGGMSRSLLQIAGLGGGIYALDRGLRAIIKSASDAQEIQSKFNVVFGQTGKEANRWAEDFGDAVGRATQDVQGWMATLQDTFVPLGYARAEAAGFSKTLVKLAVDVASFNNKADADVIRDFQSALVGNHETVRRYGVIISQATMEQEALNRGWNKSYKELTDLEKVQLRMDILLAATSDAQGDAGRTAGEYANQIKRLSANWKEFKQETGEKALPAMSSTLEYVNKVMQGEMRAKQWYGQFGGGIPGMDQPIKPKVGPYLTEQELKAQDQKARSDMITMGIEKHNKKLDEQKRLRAAANDISIEYTGLIDKEIALTGRLGEAREHAVTMQKMQNDLTKAGITDTKQIAVIMDRYRAKIDELVRAQQLARIANDVGDAFADAFERAIMGAEKFQNVLRGLAMDIAKSVLRNLFLQPLAQSISAGVGSFLGLGAGMAPVGPAPVGLGGGPGGLPAPNRHSGGAIYQSGLYNLQAGEHVSRPGGPQIVINNNTGIPLNSSGGTFDGDRVVVELEIAMADRIARGQGPLAGQINR